MTNPWTLVRQPRVRESMWFVPGLMVLGGLVLAQLAVQLDELVAGNDGYALPDTISIGVEGSRGILVAIGGSVLAVAATMFSITMSVIATASSTYGPRLVRNFMSDRANQQVLGLFVATFVYCLMVLRRIEDPGDKGDTFVPHLAVYGAIGLALLSVVALIYFLHHIADVIQVATLVHRVREELEAVAQMLYGDAAHRDRIDADPLPRDSGVVTAQAAGFVTRIDTGALVTAACELDGVVDLIAVPGTHVMVGEPLARIAGPAELGDAVRRHLHVGDVRTPDQDVHFALQQLTEMAVRATSPAMNDPYTARNAIDEIACGLVPAVKGRTPPSGWVDGKGALRLRWAPPRGADLIDTVYGDIRIYSASNPLVVRAALQLAARLKRVASQDADARLDTQVQELLAAAERSGLAEFDLERLRADVPG